MKVVGKNEVIFIYTSYTNNYSINIQEKASFNFEKKYERY
jgi:hypothetical protein